VREHQVVVPLPSRVLGQQLQLGGDAAGQRDAAGGALGLRRAELAADEVAPHADPPRGPVDVAPAQREQLALAHPRHRRSQVHHALDAAEPVVRNRAQQRLDLLGLEEVDVGVGLGERRLLDALDRVLAGIQPSSIANSISEWSVPSAFARDFGASPLRSSAAAKPRTSSRVISPTGVGPKKSTMWIRSQ
jgi:hypothetical protein